MFSNSDGSIPSGTGEIVSDRQISASRRSPRSSSLTGLIRGSHSGSNFDPRRIVPTVKDEARVRGLHGSGVAPDLTFAIPILSPYDEGKALLDDIHRRGLIPLERMFSQRDTGRQKLTKA